LGRIPHAQLFVGPEGSGTLPMAIAYAQYILCGNQNGENNGANQSCNLKFQNITSRFCLPYCNYRRSKEKPKSIDFITDWRQFIIKALMVVCLTGMPY
jgi:DNA polymerase-3 subunit delta'